MMKNVIILLFLALGLSACVPVDKVMEISEKSYIVIVKTEKVLLVVEQELQNTELKDEIGDEVDEVQMGLAVLKRTLLSMITIYGGTPPTVDMLGDVVCGCGNDCGCGAESACLCECELVEAKCELECRLETKDLRDAIEDLERLL